MTEQERSPMTDEVRDGVLLEIRDRLRDQGARLERIEAAQADHGARLARIETEHGEKLDGMAEATG